MSANRKLPAISKAPKFEFAHTLAEQEAQLAANPMMARFADSRRALASDRHRPLYHFVSPESTLNDPNGLCFWRGKWHLFYQGYPPEDAGRVHWGHAVSDDLVHWRDLPYAIYPYREESCYSGTALVEDDRVIAIYHGTKLGNMVATSSDPLLLNWDKVGDGAVIPLAKSDDDSLPYTVFDPCIWRVDDHYFALSGGWLPNGPANKQVRANFLFRSSDLAHWEYLHPFIEDDHYTVVNDDGACPYFWPIGADKHIFLMYSHMTGGQYLLGDYDKGRDKFVVTDGGLFNFGPSTPSGLHAPSACPDGEGGVIVIFNMNQGIPSRGWNQIMTLPRRLTLDADGRLLQQPAGDLASLRYDHQRVDAMTLPANEETLLDGISGSAMELELEIDPADAPLVELNVLRSPNREEVTRIAFFKHRGNRYRQRLSKTQAMNASSAAMAALPQRYESLISIDSSYSSTLPEALSRAPETAPVFLEDDEPLQLRVFIDRSVVEVFANGKQALALRVYPEREDSLSVSLRAQGRAARLNRLDAWAMRSVWES
ncbi:MAG: glycoside hydrolase family 32 protein [Chloroflexota bacterium]|nr:glycoside hydrolase family 32 protein [Chloroflexota bacterium]MDE2948995.1 glycoside hydrolase family 32 protein [Chloroflexota bacterium]